MRSPSWLPALQYPSSGNQSQGLAPATAPPNPLPIPTQTHPATSSSRSKSIRWDSPHLVPPASAPNRESARTAARSNQNSPKVSIRSTPPAPPPHRSECPRTCWCSASHRIALAAASTASPHCPHTCAPASRSDKHRPMPPPYAAKAANWSARWPCPRNKASAIALPLSQTRTLQSARSPASSTTPCQTPAPLPILLRFRVRRNTSLRPAHGQFRCPDRPGARPSAEKFPAAAPAILLAADSHTVPAPCAIPADRSQAACPPEAHPTSARPPPPETRH